MLYESPILEITNFSLEKGASTGGAPEVDCPSIGGLQPLG